MNFRYPIFLDLTGKKCVVTGQGYEIAGKVRTLVDASAEVTYVNPSAVPEIEQLAAMGLIRWHRRAFLADDLDDCFLILSDGPENAAIFELAEERKVLCNSVDDPEHCRFSFGSIHRQGELTIAISSNGWAPAVAVRVRQKIEHEIGPEYAALLEILKRLRPVISSSIADFSARRDLWYRVVDSDALELLRSGQTETAEAMIQAMVNEALSSTLRFDTSGEDANH
ncbi:MAG: bifunctional precorrin-2 dehydrogenase/sirohydrochlorin ferrochelatase [Bryobacteraceae bacterium]